MTTRPSFIRREAMPHPATGDPIVVAFSAPSSATDAIYTVEIAYQDRKVRCTYAWRGLGEPHPADVFEWLSERIGQDLISHDRYERYSEDADTSLIAYRALRDLARRVQRVFGEDYTDFLAADWSVERHISPWTLVWERLAPVISIKDAEAAWSGHQGWLSRG